MDLRFDHHSGAAVGGDLVRRRPHFGERFGGDFERDGDAIAGEQLFGLVFVNVHFKISAGIKNHSRKNATLYRTAAQFLEFREGPIRGWAESRGCPRFLVARPAGSVLICGANNGHANHAPHQKPCPGQRSHAGLAAGLQCHHRRNRRGQVHHPRRAQPCARRTRRPHLDSQRRGELFRGGGL